MYYNNSTWSNVYVVLLPSVWRWNLVGDAQMMTLLMIFQGGNTAVCLWRASCSCLLQRNIFLLLMFLPQSVAVVCLSD